MKTLWNILKTIGVIVFVAVPVSITWVLKMYDEVKNPKPEGYDEYEGY